MAIVVGMRVKVRMHPAVPIRVIMYMDDGQGFMVYLVRASGPGGVQRREHRLRAACLP
jgi:hypothetical protein